MKITQTPNMPNTKTTHKKITNERVRRANITRRLKNIFKRCEELRVSHDAKVVSVYNYKIGGELSMWPNTEEAAQLINKFLSSPKDEEGLRVGVEEYENILKDQIEELTEEGLKLSKETEEMKKNLFNELAMHGTKSMDELLKEKLECLSRIISRRLNELNESKKELPKAEEEEDGLNKSKKELPKAEDEEDDDESSVQK